MLKWITELRKNFGSFFLLLVVAVYWTQGFRSFAWLGVSFLMKDSLQLDPAATQVLQTTAFLPWSVKPIYGVLSDCVPICGSRRLPYLILASSLGFLSWMALALVPAATSTTGPLAAILLVGNVGAAMADVVVDAMVAEAARRKGSQFGGDLQTLSWLSMAVGGLVGSLTGGRALSLLKPHGMFATFAICPLAEFLACSLVSERKLGISATPEEDVSLKPSSLEREPTATESITPKHAPQEDGAPASERQNLPNADELNDVGSGNERPHAEIADGRREEGERGREEGVRRRGGGKDDKGRVEEDEGRGAGKLTQRMSLVGKLRWHAVELWGAVCRPGIYRPLTWFVVANAVVPSLATSVFYFQTDGLKLDAEFLGMARVVGWGGLMLGTATYNRWFKFVPLRTVFRWVQVALAGMTLLDVVLVTGVNKQLGVSDKAFVLATSALADAIGQFKFMPFLVLSAQLCPPGIEGTLFALFMSAHNMGATLSSYSGAALASALHITSDNFDSLGYGIAIQAIATAFPVLLLAWIPEGVSGASEDEGHVKVD